MSYTNQDFVVVFYYIGHNIFVKDTLYTALFALFTIPSGR